MPRSVFGSGGGGTSSSAVRQGINNSEDIDALLLDVSEIKNKLSNLTVSTELRAPTLRPVVVGAANQAINSGEIPAPGDGKVLMIQVAGWYNATPENAFLSIIGTDEITYMQVPITSSGAGFMLKSELPEDVGCVVQLSAGGESVIGHLNIATYVRDV